MLKQFKYFNELLLEINLLPYNTIKSNRLIIIFGLLGDFDSLEYGRIIARSSSQIRNLGITVHAIGIGDESSRKRFCYFTGFPYESICVRPDSKIHNLLGLSNGPSFPSDGISKLLLMCSGLGSPGTLKEVLRGYRGDKTASNIFNDKEKIVFNGLSLLNASFFNFIGPMGTQRPMELATLRLSHLIEVLFHWNIYMRYPSHLAQRGATFLLNTNDDLVYYYLPRGLLTFSENMSNPLHFLNALDF